MKIASIYAICNLQANQEGALLPASPADIKIIQDLLRPDRWEGQTLKSSGGLALTVGSHFLGTPYAAGTLEQEEGESLQINLRQLDCFTFVENTVALARLIRLGKSSFADFAASLEAIRYRKGLLDGYPSRSCGSVKRPSSVFLDQSGRTDLQKNG